MTNAEKYKEEIRNESYFTACAVNRIKNKRDSSERCSYDCNVCKTESIAWLMQEYEEPPVEWNKVKSGTMVWVRNSDAQSWSLREFAMYHDNRIWCYEDGLHDSMQRWNCGRIE